MYVSEQNPSEAFPPQAPQQSFGAAQPPPGQPQQAFGQAPPAGQGSFGAAPPPEGVPAQGAPPAEPAPKKKGGGLVRVVVSLVVLAALAAGGWWFSRKDAVNAQVGNCLAGTTPQELNPNNLKIVDCSQSDAGFKVVERIEGKTETEADSSCAQSSEPRWVFWSGKSGQAGTVLCLAENKP
jgi:hypothetical protein